MRVFARSRILRPSGGLLWRLVGVLWAFAHILKCRRSRTFEGVSALPHNLTPVRYTGSMNERWAVGRVMIIRYPLRRQAVWGVTFTRDYGSPLLEVSTGKSLYVFKLMPK